MYPFFIGEEYDPTARNEANKYNSILQESTNLEEVLLHSQFNSFVESRAIQFDKFLKKEGIIEGLLKLLVSSDDKLLVNAAAKVFTSKFMYVRSTTVNSDQLLNILFSELLDVATSDIQHNPDNNYQISSVMSTLLSAHKWEMVEYITNKISNDKIHVILNYPHFLLTLLDYNICTTAIKLTQWIIKTELVNLLIDTFINGNTLYEEASEALVQLTSFDSKIRESISEDSVRLFLTSLHTPPNDKVDKKWFVSQILSILSNLITTSQLQGGLSDVSESLEPIIDHIPQFITYLESDPLSVSIQNTVGEVAPFGMARMEVVNILSNLLQLDQHNYKITKILVDSNILQIFINLIIQYPWNNILHTKVVEIIDTILSSNFGFETDILTQTNVHDVVAKKLLECHRVLSERNEILPYTSIFEKIASLLTQYSDSVISDALYDSEIWAEYRRVVHGENYSYDDYKAMRMEFENQEKANNNRGDDDDDYMNENGNFDEGDDGNDESNQNDNVNGDNDCVNDSNNESGDHMNNEEKNEF